jgi:exodeoxyribonuclease VII large subunit
MKPGADEFDFEATGSSAPQPLSVSDLTSEIKDLLGGMGRVAVRGEVSRVSRASSGHVYFDLKDERAKLACKLWRTQVRRALAGELREGDDVVVHGRIDVYEPQGSYSLIVERVEARGLGALLAQLEALKAELKAKGWFERRRPLPALPRTIGVVTSRDTAALADFLRTRSQRWPLYPVRLAHAPVQGAAAAPAIARAIGRLDKSGVDVIVVCRGGGSLEDLWAFNERAVAEAVWAASVPVVTGVGHETDTTLIDLVADRRAHTPTDAAVAVIPERAAYLAALERAAHHLGEGIDRRMQGAGEALERARRSRWLSSPRWILGERAVALARAGRGLRVRSAELVRAADGRLVRAGARLDRRRPALQLQERQARLARAAERALERLRARAERAQQRLEVVAGRLAALDPEAILGRGYAILVGADGRTPVRSTAQVAPGDELVARLADGRVRSRAVAVERDAAG